MESLRFTSPLDCDIRTGVLGVAGIPTGHAVRMTCWYNRALHPPPYILLRGVMDVVIVACNCLDTRIVVHLCGSMNFEL